MSALRFFVVILVMLLTLDRIAAAGLPQADPEEVGMDSRQLARIDEIVAQGLAEKRMPGCVVCIGRRGKIVLLKAYGNKQVQPSEIPMTTDTVFDMASIRWASPQPCIGSRASARRTSISSVPCKTSARSDPMTAPFVCLKEKPMRSPSDCQKEKTRRPPERPGQ